jgi:hypothetical protein
MTKLVELYETNNNPVLYFPIVKNNNLYKITRKHCGLNIGEVIIYEVPEGFINKFYLAPLSYQLNGNYKISSRLFIVINDPSVCNIVRPLY